MFEHQSERVIAASFNSKVGLVFSGVEIVEKQFEIFRPQAIVTVQPFQLGAPDDRVDFGASHVVRGKSKDEIRIEIGMAPAIDFS